MSRFGGGSLCRLCVRSLSLSLWLAQVFCALAAIAFASTSAAETAATANSTVTVNITVSSVQPARNTLAPASFNSGSSGSRSSRSSSSGSATVKYNEYVTDMGQNISIPCTTADDPATTIWLKEGANQTRQFHAGGTLRLYRLQRDDAAIYVCLVATNATTAVGEAVGGGAVAGNDSGGAAGYVPAVYETPDATYVEALRVRVIVRSVPCAVTRLSMRISTILGVLIWEYNRTTTYAHPLKSFTAEYRLHNATHPQPWERLDPKNISPNIRYMEIYHLLPNTTYEFRIWGNNYIGPGEIASTIVTTLPEIGDDVELLRILMRDAKDFDTHVWFYAVGVVMGALVFLGLTVCLLLVRDWYEDDGLADADEWTTLDLIPNIILNPGFFEPDDPDNPSPPYTRTIIFGEDELSSSDDESEVVSIPFKRKLSLFFTGDTIKRQL